MRRSATKTRERILSASYGLLYRQGYSRVSMDDIADASGVAKRTLYQHFDSKDALVGEMLEQQREHALARFHSWNATRAETPEQVLEVVFEGLLDWAEGDRWLGSGFTRLTMELADLPGHPARQAAHRHKLEVERWLADELDRVSAKRAGALARQVVLLIEGSIALALIHREPGYIRAVGEAARQLALGERPDV